MANEPQTRKQWKTVEVVQLRTKSFCLH